MHKKDYTPMPGAPGITGTTPMVPEPAVRDLSHHEIDPHRKNSVREPKTSVKTARQRKTPECKK